MTYRKFLEELKSLTEEQLNQTVTIYDESADEYYPCYQAGVAVNDDVLDENHIVLAIKS